jgi:DNA-binding NarL/FixJ family response regulator
MVTTSQNRSTGEIRVIIAMRWDLVRRGIAEMLRSISDSNFGANVVVVGEATEPDELFAQVQHRDPDVIIARGNLLGLDAAAFMAGVGNACGWRVPVLILSRAVNPERVAAACEAGVAGYLPAEVTPQSLGAALHSFRSGNLILCDEARDALLRQTSERSASVSLAPELFASLTAREREVLPLLEEGLSNKEIAYQLGIGRRSAEMHVARLIDKFGTGSRSELLVSLLSK